MRILERDKEMVCFAKYFGKSEVLKDGKRTGEYTITYSAPGKAKVYVSTPKASSAIARGKAVLEAPGNKSHYIRTIVSEVDLGLDIDDLFWIDTNAPFNEAIEVQTFTNRVVDGGYMWWDASNVSDGQFSPWNTTNITDGNINSAPNYRIESVSKSKHHVLYGVRQL